jgi:hypothetical protein
VPDYLCTSIVVLWNVLTEHSSLSYLVDCGFICGSVLIYSLIFTYPSTNFYFYWCHIPYEIPRYEHELALHCSVLLDAQLGLRAAQEKTTPRHDMLPVL